MDNFPYQQTFRKIALFCGAALFLSTAAMAQTTAIEGNVKGEDGNGIKDALIKIERLDIKGNYKVKTDKKGHYIHAGLPLGTYKISVEVDGQQRDVVNNVRTGLGDPKVVDFNLQEQKQRQVAINKAAESGQLTKEQERSLTSEQKEAIEKQMKERQATLAKNKALNDAFNAGREAMNAKQYDVATQQFAKAAEMDPNQHVVWAQLADAYSAYGATKTGQEQTDLYAKAMESFEKAIVLKPDDAAYLNNYGLLLARAKKVPEAEAQLTKAAQLDPPNAGKYYYNLGAVLQNTSQYDAAVEAFKKATEADPNHADAQYWYATALSSKISMSADGKVQAPPGMAEALQKYLELKPDGQFAQAAKELLTTIGGQISTKYENPNAPKKPAGRKK